MTPRKIDKLADRESLDQIDFWRVELPCIICVLAIAAATWVAIASLP
jgi:hypothetical protein